MNMPRDLKPCFDKKELRYSLKAGYLVEIGFTGLQSALLRKPNTGEDTVLATRKVVTFKCSGKLRERVNGF